jgi:hypothetical protein
MARDAESPFAAALAFEIGQDPEHAVCTLRGIELRTDPPNVPLAGLLDVRGRVKAVCRELDSVFHGLASPN